MYSSNPIQRKDNKLFSNKALRLISLGLVVIGALNWGVIGINGYNFVEDLVGISWARPVYLSVGLAGLLQLVSTVYKEVAKL